MLDLPPSPTETILRALFGEGEKIALTALALHYPITDLYIKHHYEAKNTFGGRYELWSTTEDRCLGAYWQEHHDHVIRTYTVNNLTERLREQSRAALRQAASEDYSI